MFTKLPLSMSMDHLPRQRGCGCLSLKFGCIITALVVILYTLLGLAQLSVDLLSVARELEHGGQAHTVLSLCAAVAMFIVHCISFMLTVFMLLGVLRENVKLIAPWVVWKSVQLLVAVLVFVFLNTMTMVGHYDEDSVLLYAVAFFSLLVRFYMLVLVSSYCRQLVEDREETEKLRGLVNNETWYTEA